MIQEDYCSYKVSKLLKEKGLDVPCRTYYTLDDKDGDGKEEVYFINLFNDIYLYNSERNIDEINAPTHQLAMKWLREKYDIFIIISQTYNKEYLIGYNKRGMYQGRLLYETVTFANYESAVDWALGEILTKII